MLPQESKICVIYLTLMLLTLIPYFSYRGVDPNFSMKPKFEEAEKILEPANPNCYENPDSWAFRCKYPCQQMPAMETVLNQSRQQIVPIFKENNNIELAEVTYYNNSLPTYMFGDKRLLDLVDKYCYDGLLVPKVVHYVWLGKKMMSLYHYLSFIATFKYIKPCFIYLHSDILPYGPFWEYLLRRINNIIHVKRSDLKTFFGQKIMYVEHKADIVRLLVVKEYGGIYFDTDQIILRPLDKFRNYNLTLSDTRYFKKKDAHFSNAVIFTIRNSTFINMWIEKYRKYISSIWGWNSVIMPYLLYLNHSEMVHVVWNYSFLIPYINDGVDKIFFKMNTNWSKNYAVHFYIRYTKVVPSFKSIRTWNVTAGSVARFILLGTRHLCSN